MSNENTSETRTDEPPRLTVLMRGGSPVMAIPTDPAEAIAEDRRRLRELAAKAEAARPGDSVPYGYLAFMGRRHISRMVDLAEARHEGWHQSAWVEEKDGIDCTACSCGVLVPGRVGSDFTEQEFREAEGHLPFTDPSQDPVTCPRCGHGLPNDRYPGSGSGFWSLTVQRGYVCDACHDHQMHLAYGPRNLGNEAWPVTVPRRFYDESWWPPHKVTDGEGADHD